METNLL